MKLRFRAVESLNVEGGFDPHGYEVLVDDRLVGMVRRYYDGSRVDGWWIAVGVVGERFRTRKEAALKLIDRAVRRAPVRITRGGST